MLQQAIDRAARAAGPCKRVTCHIFRHSFATDLLEDGHDIRTVQQLLGHKDVSMRRSYSHVPDRCPGAVLSPADRLLVEDES